VSQNPDHVESHLLLARVSLDAKLWSQARRHLEAGVATGPSAGVFLLMAELEAGESGDPDAGRRWLLQASRAVPDPVWGCAECGAPGASWAMHCPACAAFDQFEWRSPPAPRAVITRPRANRQPDPPPEETEGSPASEQASEQADETPVERAARMT
jgi:HemY protein